VAISVIIPSRNEPYLVPTVNGILNAVVGDCEILVVLDGGNQADVVLPNDSRVKAIRHETAHGMRPSINEAAAQATGEFLLKCDAHVAFSSGFDRVLIADCDEESVVIPRRYGLDPVTWTTDQDVRDAHYLAWPWRDPAKEPTLRGLTWKERSRARAHILLDDEMTTQGSCWLMSRTLWNRIGPLDTEHYGPFICEPQEICNKAWLSGGRVLVTRKTSYAHWYKRNGQGYVLSKRQSRMGLAYNVDHWVNDRPWPGKVRSFEWLINHFWPVPGWPENWKDWQRV
jgi:glycosyltransferase involved in cell wall biosynthesis